MEHSPSVKESSPAPSTTSKGLKGVIAKARRSRKDDSSTAIATDDTNEDNERNSIDSLVRNSTRSSLDDGHLGGSSKMSKLIPKRIKKRLEQKDETERQPTVEEEDARGRSWEDSTATSAGKPRLSMKTSRSTMADDERNSLLTVESGNDSPPVAAPPLVSRDSHIGYLTASSPLVKSTTASEAVTTHPLDSPSFQNPEYQVSKSSTLPVDSSSSLSSNLAPQHAQTFVDRNPQNHLDAPAARSRSRGVSPGAKIKDVFSIGSRSKKGGSPPKSPNRSEINSESNGSNGGGGGLGGYMKRKSINLGKGSTASESLPSLDLDPHSSAASSRGELPMLNTLSPPPPQTPPNAGIEAPETLVTPPTPTDRRHSQDRPASPTRKNKPVGVVSASGNMISHRRVRSDSATHAPSKLSQAMAPPMTPMTEEGRSTGSLTGSPPGAGFFSSVFSAAQNMTNQITNSISNNPQPPPPPQQPRSAVQEFEQPQDAIGGDAASDIIDEEPAAAVKKPLAIETLGSGELSLSHLGIDTPVTANGSSGGFTNGGGSDRGSGIWLPQDESLARAEDASAARAVSQAYSEKQSTIHEQAGTTPVVDATSNVVPVLRPRSTYESSIATGDRTPPPGSLYEHELGGGNNTTKRSGSVRSRVGAVARRHRNSSSTTGGLISAAIGAGHAALANPAAVGSSPKLTGFAVASKKRNRDFHQLFKSVPEDDYLIEDYSCALQRDIILAGRIYISEGHICFSSNILGWVTTLVIRFDEVVSVEKENTAVVFPNAIAIQTLHARHTFRSLLSREATYELLIGIWKLSHPSLKSSLNGVRLDNVGTGDKTEKMDLNGSDEASDLSEGEEEVYDEDDDEEDEGDDGEGDDSGEVGNGSLTEGGVGVEGGAGGNEETGESATKPVVRKASAMGVAVGAAAAGVPTATESKASEKAAAAAATATADFPGPPTHEPTECSDSATHYEKTLKDDIIPAPLGKVYSMVFGGASGGFMAKWLLDEIKVTNLENMEDDKKGLMEAGSSRSYSYIKPLNAPIGPKSTKCLVTETVDFLDFEKSASVTASTQTPDVPSGNIFVTKTRFCFMWAPGNQTRVVMNYALEWSGKSWLKSAIEKGATDGQGSYCNDLVKALKAGVNSRPRASTSGSKPSKTVKGGKRRKRGSSSPRSATSPKPSETTKDKDSWGLFEPLHGILGPIIDILSPLISANMVIAFLLFIILFNYLRSGSSASRSSGGLSTTHSPERTVAYEAIWEREEAELWKWLADRVDMQNGASFPTQDQEVLNQAEHIRKKQSRAKVADGIRGKVRELKMGEVEVEEAIKSTEERLAILKGVVADEKRLKEKVLEKKGEEEIIG